MENYYSCVAKRTRAQTDQYLYYKLKKLRGEPSTSKKEDSRKPNSPSRSTCSPSTARNRTRSASRFVKGKANLELDESYSHLENEVEKIDRNGNKEASYNSKVESTSKGGCHEADHVIDVDNFPFNEFEVEGSDGTGLDHEVEEIGINGNKEAIYDSKAKSKSDGVFREADHGIDVNNFPFDEFEAEGSDGTGLDDNYNHFDNEVEEIDRYGNKEASYNSKAESKSKGGCPEADHVIDVDKFQFAEPEYKVEGSDGSGINDDNDGTGEIEVEEIDIYDSGNKEPDCPTKMGSKSRVGFGERDDGATNVKKAAGEVSKHVFFVDSDDTSNNDSDDSLSSSDLSNNDSDDMDYEMEHSESSASIESTSFEEEGDNPGTNDDNNHSEETEVEIDSHGLGNKANCDATTHFKSKVVFGEGNVAANAKKVACEVSKHVPFVDSNEPPFSNDVSHHDSDDSDVERKNSDFSVAKEELSSFEGEGTDKDDHCEKTEAEEIHRHVNKFEGSDFVESRTSRSHGKLKTHSGNEGISATLGEDEVESFGSRTRGNAVEVDDSIHHGISSQTQLKTAFGKNLPEVDKEGAESRKPTEKRRVCAPKGYDIVRVLLNSVLDKRVLEGEACELDSVLDKGVFEGEACEQEAKQSSSVETTLPLKFRFEDEESAPVEKSEFEKMVDNLFDEMEFSFKCEEMGSFDPPLVEKENTNAPETETNQFTLCGRGKHQLFLDEEIGKRCLYCSFVELEIKYITPPWQKNTAGVSERKNYSGENDFSVFDGFRVEASGDDSRDGFNHIKGTVWDIIPGIRESMYPHQQEGFEFLWKNLAGTINIPELKSSDLSGVGGCIISHAPGTGKTRLTIVFIQAYLKLFPNCRPVIIAPASMLLTWEEEFRKWKVDFPFHNLNNLDLLGKENKLALNFLPENKRQNKDAVRMVKIHSWTKDKSILGISYNLYERLAGEKFIKEKGNKKQKKVNTHKKLEELRKILLEFPDLVVLDEGHIPRNERSCIWNTLLKLQTEKRIILSGTPFQNNFGELFNTLSLVRPAKAGVLAQEKIFADVIMSRKDYFRERSRGKWVSVSSSNGKVSDDAIEKLKATIAPFVHVHKGSILQESLPGLKETLILLNPPPLQKRLIKRMEGLQSTFEYEHKVALISVHPSLFQHCSLSDNEKSVIDQEALEELRLNPDKGVKTRFIMELIRLSVAINEKVLIFSQYIHPLGLIKDQIREIFAWDEGKQVLQMQGKLEQKHRQKLINLFNDPNSEAKVLLASTKCCSEGINLVGASRVILVDVVWNPSVERQAISRAYRLGQKKVVYTYHLMTSGNTEWDKYCRQAEKDRLSELVFSSTSKENDKQKNPAAVFNDRILEEMVGHTNLKDMFEKIIYQPKERNFIENLGLASMS